MGFFDAVPRPEPPPRQPPPEPWMGPPSGVTPGAVAVELLLGVSELAAISLGPMFVWPDGVRMTLWIAGRDPDTPVDPYGAGRGRSPGPDDEWPPPDVLRLGVEYSDGRRTTTDTTYSTPREGDPARPLLWSQGGGGGRGSFHQDFWLWPFPPPGILTFACTWPSLGLRETLSELDTRPLHDAVARAREIWPERAD